MSHFPFLKSYYPPSTPLNLNPSQLPFINPIYSRTPIVEQALYTANFYAMHQYNQQLHMGAQLQAFARAQAQAQAQALLLHNKQIQQANLNTLKLTSEFSDQNETKMILKEAMIGENPSGKLDLEAQVRGMLDYFTQRFNKSNQEEITREKIKYRYSHVFSQLFDELVKKYSSVSRCREDMVRFVLRKALTFLRNRLRDSSVAGARAASIAMCKKYFGQRMNEMLENVNVEDEKEVLAFLLPYKKNSRNRTANSRFMGEIFSSEEFRKDYVCFLEKLDEILAKDNQKKMEKFLSFLVECVKQNTIEKVRNFKRLPWVEEWLASTKVIANELPNINQKETLYDEIKDELSSSSKS
jgi:hypothetical protein